MKKLILIIFILTQFLFADGLKIIDKMSDIPKNKDVVLIFSMKYCPYCVKQEKTILKDVQPKFKKIEYLKVMKGSKIFQKLNNSGIFNNVTFYPTTFIVKIDEENQMYLKYHFVGFQRSSSIISILNDEDIMGD